MVRTTRSATQAARIRGDSEEEEAQSTSESRETGDDEGSSGPSGEAERGRSVSSSPRRAGGGAKKPKMPKSNKKKATRRAAKKRTAKSTAKKRKAVGKKSASSTAKKPGNVSKEKTTRGKKRSRPSSAAGSPRPPRPKKAAARSAPASKRPSANATPLRSVKGKKAGSGPPSKKTTPSKKPKKSPRPSRKAKVQGKANIASATKKLLRENTPIKRGRKKSCPKSPAKAASSKSSPAKASDSTKGDGKAMNVEFETQSSLPTPPKAGKAKKSAKKRPASGKAGGAKKKAASVQKATPASSAATSKSSKKGKQSAGDTTAKASGRRKASPAAVESPKLPTPPPGREEEEEPKPDQAEEEDEAPTQKTTTRSRKKKATTAKGKTAPSTKKPAGKKKKDSGGELRTSKRIKSKKTEKKTGGKTSASGRRRRKRVVHTSRDGERREAAGSDEDEEEPGSEEEHADSEANDNENSEEEVEEEEDDGTTGGPPSSRPQSRSSATSQDPPASGSEDEEEEEDAPPSRRTRSSRRNKGKTQGAGKAKSSAAAAAGSRKKKKKAASARRTRNKGRAQSTTTRKKTRARNRRGAGSKKSQPVPGGRKSKQRSPSLDPEDLDQEDMELDATPVNNRRKKKKKKRRRRSPSGRRSPPKPMMFNQSSGSSSESTDHMMERKRRERLARDRGKIQPVNLGLFDEQMAADEDTKKARGMKGSKKNKNADISPMQIDLNVDWNSIGGLTGHVQKLKEMVVLPMLYPKEFERFKMNPPKGVIFHGPPGTGKTLVARVLAAQCSRPGKKVTFYMRKGADCLSKWVGEAERQLRLLFDEAHKNQPSIIFFDEIDGLAPVRSSRQDQIHSSIVSTLLALMDGLDSRGQVIIIGATNRIDAIDPALRRPGRFDRELCFTLPSRAARRHILQIKTKSWQPPVASETLDDLAEKCVGYCGADLEALCREAFMCSVRRTFPQIYTSEVKLQINPDQLVVLDEDFDTALLDLVPAAQRSAVVFAKALPKSLAPLLDSQLRALGGVQRSLFPLSCSTKAERMNLEDAKASNAASGGGGDDQKGREEEESSVANKPSEFEKCLVKPCRPRLLVSSPGGRGCGAQDLGVAVLHLLEEYPTYSLDLSTVLGDVSTRSPAEFCLRLFKEARKNAPSVIYWPRVEEWWTAASPQLRLVLASLLDDVPEDCPVLVLATSECSFADLPDGALREQVFRSPDASLHFKVAPSPKLDEQRVFWQTVRPLCLEPPKRKRSAVVPPTLPPAPVAAAVGAVPMSPAGSGKTTSKQDAVKARIRREKEERDMARKLDFNRVRCFIRTCCSRLNRHYKDFLEPIEEEQILQTDIGLMDIRERNNDRECPTVEKFLKDIDRLVKSVQKTHNSQSIEAREYLNEACHLQDQALSLACQADRDLCYRVRQHKQAIREERVAKGEPGPDETSADEEEEGVGNNNNRDSSQDHEPLKGDGEEEVEGTQQKMDEDEEDEKGPPVPNPPAGPEEDAKPAAAPSAAAGGEGGQEEGANAEEKRPTTAEEAEQEEEGVQPPASESAPADAQKEPSANADKPLPSPPVVPLAPPPGPNPSSSEAAPAEAAPTAAAAREEKPLVGGVEVAPGVSPIKPAQGGGGEPMDMDDNPAPPAPAAAEPAPPPPREPSPSPPREVVLDKARLDTLLERCAQAGAKRGATVFELSAAMTRVQTALHHCSNGVERAPVLDALDREARRFERPRRVARPSSASRHETGGA